MKSMRPRALSRLLALASNSTGSSRHRKNHREEEKRRRRRNLAASIEPLENRHLLTFAIDLIADVNQFGFSSLPEKFVQMGNDAYFVADDGVSGTELWKTDGTENGTVQVADVLPGPDASSPSDLTVIGNDLFFIAFDANGETDLWKSDGTTAGTVEVFDADPNGVYYLKDLTASGGKLFFTAYEIASGYELWTSDGTSGGTQLVLDINPDNSVFDRPEELTDVNGTLFFTALDDGYYNRELWKSDGTAGGTVLVKDIGVDIGDPGNPGDDDFSVSSTPLNLTNIGGTLYFTADDFELGTELFKSDGTTAGTVMVEDLNVGGSSDPDELTAFNNLVYFTADAGSGRELYSTDGSTINFVVKTSVGSAASMPSNLTVVGNDLFFSAEGAVPVTKITAEVPLLTVDNSRRSAGFAGLVSSVASTYQGVISTVTSSGSFSSERQTGTDDGPGWVHADARIGQTIPMEGTVELSTIAVNDLYIEDIDGNDLVTDAWEWTISDPGGLTNIDFSGFASGNEFSEPTEGLLFELFLNGSSTRTDFDEVNGQDLDNWFAKRTADNIDITHAGGATITSATVRLTMGRDGGPEDLPNNFNEALVINAVLTADLSSNTPLREPGGRELHKTDGTVGGTVIVKDINTTGDSEPGELTESGGKLFFSADDPTGSGRELWVSDGTDAGTMLLVDSRPGQDAYGAQLNGDPRNLFDLDGQLLFTTVDGLNDRELWSSDGMAANTELLKNVNPGTLSSNARDFVTIGNNVFFIADDGINGEAVWSYTSGSGTLTMVADATPSDSDNVSGLTQFGTEVVFFNDAFGSNGGVFRTNGSGTPTLLSEQVPIPFNDDGDLFIDVNGRLYFVADDGANGEELWTWTASGPSMAEELTVFPGATGSDPRDLVNFNNNLYFSATTAFNGNELFRTNGIFPINAADIIPGNASSNPTQLTVSGGNLYFTADNGSNGRELWSVSILGASMVSDIRAGGNSSNPTELTDVDGTLYFSADNGSDGFEPFMSQGTAATTSQIANINSGGNSSNPSGFMSHNGLVYFSAEESTTGRELWSTDGTSANTAIVADLRTGTDSSNPVPEFDTGQRLLFVANGDGDMGRELWATDGTSARTIMVEDLNPNFGVGSDPMELIDLNGTIIFSADDGLAGQELFQLVTKAPEVVQIAISDNDGSTPLQDDLQRSVVDRVTLVFDSEVEIPNGSITIRNRDTNTQLTSLQINQTYDQGRTFVDITFGTGPSVVDRDPSGTTGFLNSLDDGNYELTVSSAGVMSIESGAQMAANLVHGNVPEDQFYRWFGDISRDRNTDALDFSSFLGTFNKNQSSPVFNEAFDILGNGNVDALDFSAFLARFQKRLDFV